MSTFLSEQQIASLIAEQKTVPPGLMPLGAMGQRNYHKRKEFKISTESGNEFLVAIRQSVLNMMDFSVILGYRLPQVYTVFRLRRYNGKHQHTNALERQTFYDFHIHMATERYQAPGFKEDHFAATTSRYFDLESAIQCLLSDCGFRSPFEDSPLFTGKLI